MSIYDHIYNILNNFIFGGNVIPGSFQDSSLSLLSTCLCVFVVLFPFILAYRFVRLLSGD